MRKYYFEASKIANFSSSRSIQWITMKFTVKVYCHWKNTALFQPLFIQNWRELRSTYPMSYSYKVIQLHRMLLHSNSITLVITAISDRINWKSSNYVIN